MVNAQLFDIETNAIKEQDVTKLHCMAALDLDDLSREFLVDRIQIGHAIRAADCLIGHNIVGYDLRVLDIVFDIRPRPECVILDTMILSNYLNVDRQPGHSLEKLGQELKCATPKIPITDFETLTPELQERCIKDVELNYEILKRLVQWEVGSTLTEFLPLVYQREELQYQQVSRGHTQAYRV